MITINKFLREIGIQWHNSPHCFLNIHLGHEPTLWIFSRANPFLFAFSLQYNDYVHFIEPCFKGILVQADRDNREVSTGPLSMELRWLSSCRQSTGLRCCEVKLWGQGTALSQQGWGFRSQQQFSGACWLLGLPQAAAARGQLVGWAAAKASLCPRWGGLLVLWCRRVQQPWGGQPVSSCSATLWADWYF